MKFSALGGVPDGLSGSIGWRWEAGGRVSKKCHIQVGSDSGQNQRLYTWAQALDNPETVDFRIMCLLFIYLYITILF